ncbi:MAG: hypothetical protein N5P05_004243 (plasmid) [Chroococcopsis gigantea SAG 12.99]|jgi:conjugative relaxase-like TrwC/TraI family protein|nr:hypothetical protein [Chroococcopsis gigantea SAG 12.99]
MVATVGRCYTNPKDYAQDNYYTEGDCFANSEWLGKACTALGLKGQIQEAHFLNAYHFLDPQGLPLRRKLNYSSECKRQNRPGTDVTLSAPKSISVAALVFKESDITDAHSVAVRSTMEYVEKNCIYYQAKQKNKKLTLQSCTAQIATFVHDDNRNKDPQLHTHCVVLNQTLCPDGKWRAVANHELYVQVKTIGAYYAHELARSLQQKGWEIKWTDDHIFELASLDKDQIDGLFSTRSKQIEAELSKSGLTRATATAAQKQTLCLKTRPPKKQNKHPEDRERQLDRWRQKALSSGLNLCKNPSLVSLVNSKSEDETPSLIESACDTLIAKQGAFYKHELLRECLRQSQGRYDTREIEDGIERYESLVPTPDGRLTTAQQLASGSFPPRPDRERERATVIDGSEKRGDPSLDRALELLAKSEGDGESVTAYRLLHAGGKLQIYNDDEERIYKLVSNYVNRPAGERERTLILTSNDSEKERLTTTIRAGLISCGALGDKGITIETLRKKKLDSKSVSQAHHYRRGDVIKFAIENAHFSKDGFYRVTDVNDDGTLTLIDTTGAGYTLPLSKYKQREVYSVVPLEISPGERMRFTKTLRSKEHQQLKGGRFTVEEIRPDGRITISSRGKSFTLSPSVLLHCDYHYVDTLYSSVRQKADYCIYSASKGFDLTSDRLGFYKAAIRAKQEFIAYIPEPVDLELTASLSPIEKNTSDLIPDTTPTVEEKDKRESPSPEHQSFESKPPGNTSSSSSQTKSTGIIEESDAELMQRILLLKEWEKNIPVEPSVQRGENLNLRIEKLKKDKRGKEEQLKLRQIELSGLGSPRSLLNPFGPKREVIQDKMLEIRLLKEDIGDITQDLNRAKSEFKTWQEKARAYLKWHSDSKTKEMQQFSEQLKSPEMQTRLRRIKLEHSIYKAATSILNMRGTLIQGGRYFQGARYRVLERENTLAIFRNDHQEPLFVATNKKDTGGIIEITRFALKENDIDIILESAKHLQEKEKGRDNKRGPSLGR